MSRALKCASLSACLLFLVAAAKADFATPATNISNTATDSRYPKIAHQVGSLNVFAIWAEVINPTEDHLYFSKSTDAGTTWSAPQELTTGGQISEGGSYDFASIALAVEEPHVHVVMQWREDEADDYEILYKHSGDRGDTWDDSISITDNSTDSRYPDVAARGEHVHVSFMDEWPGNFDIMYKRINNYGAGSIDLNRRLTFSSIPSYFPHIAVSASGSTVHIVYEEYQYIDSVWVWNLFYKHIDDAGAGGYLTRQLTFGTAENRYPDIVTSLGPAPEDQYVYIVYQAFWPGNRTIMYKRLTSYGHAGGTTYTARPTYSTTHAQNASLDFDDFYNDVHIAYWDNWPGNAEIMYRRLTDYGGAGFTGARVSWGSGVSYLPSVAALGHQAFIAWEDGTSGNHEIYVKKGN